MKRVITSYIEGLLKNPAKVREIILVQFLIKVLIGRAEIASSEDCSKATE
jgi:hypothetical protein